MKITVITVSFNSAATIADTLRSVASQTHPEVEHIVVDGQSVDNTLAIVRLQASPKTVVVSEPDKGIYDAMNKGLRLATGDWVGFLNADDVFAHPNVLASIADAARANPAADAIYGDLVYVHQDDIARVFRHWRSGSFSIAQLRLGWMPPHPTFYVRADRLAKVGAFDASLKISADYDFMLRCLNRSDARAAYIPDVLVRMRAGGVSNRSLSAMLDKSREDLRSLRSAGFVGWPTLVCKNLRKIPQFFRSA
jgi:glycosyltransferase